MYYYSNTLSVKFIIIFDKTWLSSTHFLIPEYIFD